MVDAKSKKGFTCYWGVALPYNFKEKTSERRARRERDWAILKAAGFERDTRFHFISTDPDSKKEALKVEAEALAAKIEAATGVKMDVHEGSYV